MKHASSEHEVLALVINLGHMRPTLLRALRMLAETVVVPTMILYACVLTVGVVPGLIAVIAWCGLSMTVRWLSRQPVPGTLMIVVAVLIARTSLALALSSAYVYLLQPIVGSVLMAAIFLGSVAFRRPIAMRLARDFVDLPALLLSERRVRQMFVQVSLLWGLSRLLDAVLGVVTMRLGLEAGLLSRGLLSGLLTVASIGLCAYWGWSRLRRIPGVVFRVESLPAPA